MQSSTSFTLFRRRAQQLVIASLTVAITLGVLPQSSADAGSFNDAGTPTATSAQQPQAESSAYDLSPTQWGLAAVRAQQAWSVTRGEGVIVAVIDSGVDGAHPDLVGRVSAGYSTVSQVELEEGEQSDGNGHGTHVAAIIAGDDDGDGVVGIAPKAIILPVQALASNGSGDDRTVADAIDYAVRNNAQVINLSLGGSVNPFANGASVSCDAVARAYDANVVVVVSSGNSGGYGNPLNQPASCRGALSVAALDETVNRTYFSSYDNTVRIAAPGRRIVSATPSIDLFPYDQWDGTSMAAPHVAGVAALLRAAHPTWTAQQVVERLLSSAVDIGVPGPDSETGAGLVDAAAALGLAPITIEQSRANVAAVSVPRILRATTDEFSTTLDWEAPVGVQVERYTATFYEEDGTFYEEDVPKGDLSVVLPYSAFPLGTLTITAHTANGERKSFPFTRIDYIPASEDDAPSAVVTKVSARWVSKGIEVKFETNGIDGIVDLTVLGSDDSLVVDIEVPSTQKTTFLPVALSDPNRARNLTVIGYTDGGGSKVFQLSPQFQISAVLLSAGSGYRAVSGSTFTACLGKKLACQGQVVEVRDTRTNKVLATTRVLENLTYTAIFRWSASTKGSLQVTVSKVPAQPVVVPATPAAKGARR